MSCFLGSDQIEITMYKQILDFWFKEIDPQQWWTKDPAFDQLIYNKFHNIHQQAISCELFHWRDSAHGRLAEIIVLDQFSRNIYRDKAMSFAQDPLALALAQQAVAAKADAQLTQTERNFLYMPYMHSESLLIHTQAVALYKANGNEVSFNFELKHKEIIEQFGRYPHRNKILGRKSTQQELEFLKLPDSSF